MAGGKDPALPLYAAEWLTDRKVVALPADVRLSLVNLWCVLWLDGPIPAEQVEAALEVARVPEASFDRLRTEALVVQDELGRWHSPRLEAERLEREELRRRRSEAGRKGNAKRWSGNGAG